MFKVLKQNDAGKKISKKKCIFFLKIIIPLKLVLFKIYFNAIPCKCLSLFVLLVPSNNDRII